MVASKKFAPRLNSLRARLLLLVLLVLAAPVGTLLYTADQESREGAREAALDAMRGAQLAALEYQQRLEGAHQFLEALSAGTPVAQPDGEACTRLTGYLLNKYTVYENIAAAGPDGRVFCSALPGAADDNWADQGWFRQALQANDVVVGDFEIDQMAQGPVLPVAHPVRDDMGNLRAVSVVKLPVDWLARYEGDLQGGGGGTVAIVNQDGAILVKYPAPDHGMAQPDAVEEFVQAIGQAPESGSIEAVGPDSVRRLYAYVRLSDKGSQGSQARLYVQVGLPASLAYAGAQEQLLRTLSLFAVAAAVAIIVAWWGGGLLVLHPVGSLLRVTGALGRGNLTARAGPPYVSGELGQLARAVDGMAEALGMRDEERTRAEAQVRELNTGLERRVAERTEELKEANQSLMRYAQEQSILFGLSTAIAGAMEPRELLDAVVDIVLRALHADAVWVLVADRVISARGSVTASKGLPEEFIRAEAAIPPEACHACELLSQDEQLCCEPQLVQRCPRLAAGSGTAGGLHNHVSLPLLSPERVLGVLNVGWSGPHDFSPANRALLANIGRQLSVALQKAELYVAATERARRLAVMNTIGHALSATLDLDCVLDSLIESVTSAVDAGAAGVALVEHPESDDSGGLGDSTLAQDRREFSYRRATGPGAQPVIGSRVWMGEGLAGQALAERRPVRIQNAAAGETASWRDGCLTGRDVIGLPLIAGEEVVGALELAKGGPGGLDAEDVQLLEAVAAQAAVAIENALLYQRQRAQYHRLEESQAQLVQAEKSAALGGLAAALAHEINNPLQSLRGHIEMVTDFPLKQKERAQYLQVARQEIVRLSEITHRILNYYRPAQVVWGPVEVNELVQQTLLLAGKQLERAHIEVTIDLANSRSVIGVRDQLMQVFLNVLINAIQAIQDSGHIHIATSCDSECVVVSFTNDGPPIATEHLGRIFSPNFTTKAGGTGLGLFIARNIIQQHNGTIVAQNLDEEQGAARGVVFTIRLPVAGAAKIT